MQINKNIAISENGLLFHPGTGESFSLNPIGVEIINLIRQEKPFDAVADVILEKYNTDRATFDRDYTDFIGLLKHHRLLVEDDE